MYVEDVEILERFTNRGSVVHRSWKSCQEVLQLIGLPYKVTGSLHTSVYCCRHLCRRTKIRIFKSIVLPVVAGTLSSVHRCSALLARLQRTRRRTAMRPRDVSQANILHFPQVEGSSGGRGKYHNHLRHQHRSTVPLDSSLPTPSRCQPHPRPVSPLSTGDRTSPEAEIRVEQYFLTRRELGGTLHCLSTPKIHRHTETSRGSVHQPQRHFAHIHVDVLGSLPPSGHHYLFTIVNHSTR